MVSAHLQFAANSLNRVTSFHPVWRCLLPQAIQGSWKTNDVLPRAKKNNIGMLNHSSQVPLWSCAKMQIWLYELEAKDMESRL